MPSERRICEMHSCIAVVLDMESVTPGAGFTPPSQDDRHMNVVDADLESNAQRTSTFPWGELFGQLCVQLKVIIIHCNTSIFWSFQPQMRVDAVVTTCGARPQPATVSASYSSLCVARCGHCEARTVFRSAPHRFGTLLLFQGSWTVDLNFVSDKA